MGTTKSGGDPMKCSFCGRTQHEVDKLIGGPKGVYICDACVGLCNEIIGAERAGTPA